MSRVTNAELAVKIDGTNERLDAINGRLKKHDERLDGHDERLGGHDVKLAEMSVEEKHHSVNWDRFIQVGIAILQALILYKLFNGQ